MSRLTYYPRVTGSGVLARFRGTTFPEASPRPMIGVVHTGEILGSLVPVDKTINTS
jgi:hypothetical protein